jgi:hypothetical protein
MKLGVKAVVACTSVLSQRDRSFNVALTRHPPRADLGVRFRKQSPSWCNITKGFLGSYSLHSCYLSTRCTSSFIVWHRDKFTVVRGCRLCLPLDFDPRLSLALVFIVCASSSSGGWDSSVRLVSSLRSWATWVRFPAGQFSVRHYVLRVFGAFSQPPIQWVTT